MKKLITIFAVAILGFSASAQEMIPMSALGATDTVAVMEFDISKVSSVTDSTSLVEYQINDLNEKFTADTSVAQIISLAGRLFTPSGLGYSINADRIKGAGAVTDSTCYIYYLFGNKKKKVSLDISIGDLSSQINAL